MSRQLQLRFVDVRLPESSDDTFTIDDDETVLRVDDRWEYSGPVGDVATYYARVWILRTVAASA